MHAPDSFDRIELDFADYERCPHGPHVLRCEFHIEGYTRGVRVECAVDRVEFVQVAEAVAEGRFDAKNFLADSVQ